MSNTIENVYFVTDPKGNIMTETAGLTKVDSLSRYVFSFMPFNQMNAVDVENVWVVAMKNGYKLHELAIPPIGDAEEVIIKATASESGAA